MGSIDSNLSFSNSCKFITLVFGSIKSLNPTPNLFLIWWGVSRAKSYPFVIIQIRSARWSASSRCWELIIIEHSFFICLINYQICWRDSTSRPEVGSSRIRSWGFDTIAIASESFLFIPPDNSFINFSLCSVNITKFSVSETNYGISFFGIFFASHTSSRCS